LHPLVFDSFSSTLSTAIKSRVDRIEGQ